MSRWLNLFINVLRGLRAFTVQFYTEANVKNGLQFAASSYFTDLTAGEVLDTIVITGDKPVIIKAQYTALRDGGDILADWYKNPTYTGGSDITSAIYNQNDINPKQTTVNLYGVSPINPISGNYSPNDASKPVVTNVGTKIQPTTAALGTITQASSGASARSTTIGLDHVLDANSTYLFRRTCVADTGGLFGYTTWYEGKPDLPRKEFNL